MDAHAGGQHLVRVEDATARRRDVGVQQLPARPVPLQVRLPIKAADSDPQ